MEAKVAELRTRLQDISDIGGAISILRWDQYSYMPKGGAASRARQVAALARIAHGLQTAPRLGELLSELAAEVATRPAEDELRGIVLEAKRDYDRGVRVPERFVVERSAHTAAAYEAWCGAREANDYRVAEPFLHRSVELSREYSSFFPEFKHPADIHIDDSEPGMTAELLRTLFAELRAQLVPIVETLCACAPPADDFLFRHFPSADQVAFGLDVIRRFGFDFDRGRQDFSPHPYSTTISLGDVRITTNINEHDLMDGLSSTLHESGHGMYQQGIRPVFDGTPLSYGASTGVHESQARLWENLVGRSREFWTYYFPKLADTFPGQLGGVSLEQLVRAINVVRRSKVRTNADEVTYNLHVVIRFDLELALMTGELSTADLAEAWRERYRADLGITDLTDKEAVLQDVHWYDGLLGGSFHGYAIGNVLAAQFFDAALAACPDIPAEIAAGRFAALHGWLRDNIYQHGKMFTPAELAMRATGKPMSVEPFIRYLRAKYGRLYGVAL
ncbi:MAG: carboxypeptidase M32 [Candidatus Schekmanbacteria bacterium]|nr:carboxypeptidase M32 [Candidatus Schekmanbacteria bacterium]